MRLLVASLTANLFYGLSVKSLSIGPLPCTTPEGCSPQAPRCIKCPDAGENTPGYCSFLDPRWQTDLCLNLGYAQFCPNACVNRQSVSGGPVPAQGIRGPIDTGSPSGTTPETVPQPAPVTVPETAPETVPDSRPSVTPETVPDSRPSVTPETVPNTNPSVTPETVPNTNPGFTPGTGPGTTQQSAPLTIPDGTPGQQRIPAGQPGTPRPIRTQPGGSSQPTKEGSTMEVWPTVKEEEQQQRQFPSTTPSSPGDSPSAGQTLQIPTIPNNSDDRRLVPDPNFQNNDQPAAETRPGGTRGNGRGDNPMTIPNNLSEEPTRYTPPQLAFATTIGDQDGDASQDMSAFSYFDTSTTS